MSYKKLNNILGWSVGILATIVYLLTREGSISLWDCGEFVSCAYKIQVAHSPGAPLFSIVAKMFTLFSSGDGIGRAVNDFSALVSGLTITFLFWTITHFAKKIVGENKQFTSGELIGILGSGLVGSLAFTFSDTFWFSAVEGEVYASSSLLTAIVFWAILKWEERSEMPHADRWIVFIAFIMGLSTGVHLLNLLAIPSIVLVYYFKRYKPTTKGIIFASIIGLIALVFVQYGIIIYVPKFALVFDVVFVNDFGLPFNSGVLFFFILLAVALYFLYRFSLKKGMYYLQLAVWCTTFILIGYSVFITTVIRSNADVSIDMGNPDNAPRLISYLSREQYGNVPIFFGPYYDAQPVGVKSNGHDYFKGNGKYDYISDKREYEYAPEDIKFFPRIWDGNSPAHKQFYLNALGLTDADKPTFGDNIKFFATHQFWQMYMRYFLWNFVGRENDFQGRFFGEPKDGGVLSGISFLDKNRLGDVSKLPVAYTENKAKNTLYFLPLILGIIGLVFQFKKQKFDAAAVLNLFFFTGIAIMIYVNNTPDQPRERDYSYVGSTYAFSIWIGLGVLALSYFLQKYLSKNLQLSSIVATAICLLAVPALMASKEWDDHDRSKKTIGIATGVNYLESCAPNAILFTEGDNDTYPLWYAQEVLGLRKDIRVINLSLLGIDWYINQLNYKVNEADAIKMLWKPEAYLSSKRDASYLNERLLPQDSFYDLSTVLAFSNDDANSQVSGDNTAYIFPTNRFKIKVDKDKIIKNKIVPESMYDKIVPEIKWVDNKKTFLKNDNALLNIIAANMFDRPIYFSSTINPENFQGLEKYLLLEGITLRFAPIYNPNASIYEPGTVNTEKMWNTLMKKFQFGGAESGKVYFDEPNRRTLTNFRAVFSKLARQLVAEGDTARAKQALNYVTSKISLKSLPNDISQLFIGEAYYIAGDKVNGAKIAKSFADDAKRLNAYMNSVPDSKKSMVFSDMKQSFGIVQQLALDADRAGDSKTSKELQDLLMQIAQSNPTLSEGLRQQQQQQQQQMPTNPLAN